MPLFYTIPQSHCVIIERFGRFNRVQREGLHARIPIIDHIRYHDDWSGVATKAGWLIELAEQHTDTPPRPCHTKDNVAVTANASVYWRIIDPVRARYEVDVLPRAVADSALNVLRANIGKLDLDMLLSERRQLNEKVAAELSDIGKKWGVLFTRVEIQELVTSEDVSSAMLQQMEAERHKRAIVSEAEGEAIAKIKLAEGEKRASILRAEGVASALDRLAQAEKQYLQSLGETVSAHDAVSLLVAQKYLDGFRSISANPADKVYLPNSFHGIMNIPIDSGIANDSNN